MKILNKILKLFKVEVCTPQHKYNGKCLLTLLCVNFQKAFLHISAKY